MKKIDMSSEAISRRLRQVDQLRYLCLSLMKAKKKDKLNTKEKSKNWKIEKKTDENGGKENQKDDRKHTK